jgi:hypothetical protein
VLGSGEVRTGPPSVWQHSPPGVLPGRLQDLPCGRGLNLAGEISSLPPKT